jgi:acetylglutamate kinase
MRVIKLGGRVQSDPALPGVIAAAWQQSPSLVVVHGGGDEASALMRAFGREPQFRDGKRVTAPEDIETLRMALSGSANQRLVSQLVGAGVRAVGLSGEDASLIEAVAAERDTLGEVGTPRQVHVALLTLLMAGGFCPVVSPLARDADQLAAALNVNGDDAAAAIAAALGAEELLLVSDVDAVRLADGPAATLTEDQARAAIADGVAIGGMAAKLHAALDALARGVGAVRIGSLRAIHDGDAGTRIARAPKTASTPVLA